MMNRELGEIRRLTAALRENLVRCGENPDVDPVHDTRTGTRRLQATLENLVRETPEGDPGEPVRQAATALMRQLKKIRRAAAPVRDLDVHRKLLQKLMERILQPGEHKKEASREHKQEVALQEPARPGRPEMLETREAGLRTTGIARQADDLDAWLQHRRTHAAEALQAEAPALTARLDRKLAALEEAMQAATTRRQPRPPAVLALENFARLATEMQLLDAGNLHDFRKGAKKARYVAELAAQGDRHAADVGKALKKLQDEIGDWHDWLVLADEAHAAPGDEASELTGLVEAKREERFVAAMKTAAKLRGRLMGEWLAAAPIRRPARRSARHSARRPPQRATGASRTRAAREAHRNTAG